MDFIKYSFIILVLVSVSCGVKVNLQGSLSLGKDVINTLTHLMRRGIPSRRSMSVPKETDIIQMIIKTAFVCKDLPFCEGRLQAFLNNYIAMLTQSIEGVLESIIDIKPKTEEQNASQNVFEEELNKLLPQVRKVLRDADSKVTDTNEGYYWIDTVKKINALFQSAAILYATDRLDDKSGNNVEIKKKLIQKFVLATMVVETQHEIKLCTNYRICSTSFECTKGLHTLLETLLELDEDKVKLFIRYLADSLLDSTFYSHISDVTAVELQVILHDMSYFDKVKSKEILRSVFKAVEDRINALKTNTPFKGGRDVELVHIILSDMDHFYRKRKNDPFHHFLSDFFEWAKRNLKMKTSVHGVIQDLGEQLLASSPLLQTKIIHEVRSFLELTVDPEK